MDSGDSDYDKNRATYCEHLQHWQGKASKLSQKPSQNQRFVK